MAIEVQDVRATQELVDLIAQIEGARLQGIKEASIGINALCFDEDAQGFGRGRPSTAAANAQFEILTLFNRIERFFPTVTNDSNFVKFLSNLSLRIFRERGYKSELPFQEALIEFAVSAFDLYKESGVPNSIIIGQSHKFSVNQIADILKHARTFFGGDKDSEPLVRTAALQVFTKKYDSVKEAKSSYDDALKDARTLFGGDKDSETVVRTAAVQVFFKLYKETVT